jgi:NAD(P)-dependent dehydrogenase (short-subunit alcohol dehydrogenase family)
MTSAETTSAGHALSGRCAVVTGSAAGIGRAIAQTLIAQGASVHGLDRDASAQQRLAAALGERYLAYVVDLADRAACDRALLELQARLPGRCDILINNAGISRLHPFASSDDAIIDSQFAINFVAAFRVTRTLLPALRASGRSVIINIASELALVGAAGYSVYCATKGAVLAWSRALAVELATEGIRVNAVCPGPIDTALLQQEFATQGDASAARAAEVATVPLGRLGAPSDIAAVVAFLASDAAAFATGAAWIVDGGKTAR